MTTGYFHGGRFELDTTGSRQITAQSDESIYLVGTSDDAEADAFPIGKTTLISSLYDTDLISALGTGDLSAYVNGIHDNVNCHIYVHRVAAGQTDAETMSKVIGGIDPITGKRSGIQAAYDVRQGFDIDPSILIAPGYSQNAAVGTELASVSKRLAAVYTVDGPNGTIEDAIAYRGDYGDMHGYMVDPNVLVWDTNNDAEVQEAASARAAAVIANTPWWESASSRPMYGITGIAKDIDYRGGDGTSRAEMLNKNHIGTIIRDGGFQLFGGRSLSTDPKFAFFKRARVVNVLNRTLLRQTKWARDNNLKRRFYEAVAESVNEFLKVEVEKEHLAGGKCWVNPKLNTPSEMEAGSSYFDFDFVEYGENEKMTFTAHINNGYLANILPAAA